MPCRGIGIGGSEIHEFVAGSYASTARNADRKSTRLNSSHSQISYAVFCLKKKKKSHCSSTLVVVFAWRSIPPRPLYPQHSLSPLLPVRPRLHDASRCCHPTLPLARPHTY